MTDNLIQKENVPDSTNKNRLIKYFLIALGIIAVIDVVVISYIFAVQINRATTAVNRPKNAAVISGHLDLNGYLPPQTTVTVQMRDLSQTNFVAVANINDPVDGSAWSWDGALDNSYYELQAVAKNNGTVIAESDILGVSAPAVNETLRIISKAMPPQTETGSLSGVIDLNGFIPPNATITITAQKQSEAQKTTIVSNLSAADGVAWSWSGAIAGTTYAIQATLFNGSIIIGQSAILTLAVPSANEILTVNSTAQAPRITGTISGAFSINGVAPAGATINLATRISGTPNFNTVATGLIPTDGGSWVWSNAQAGLSYDLLAYLMVNGNSVGQSQLLVVTAPAQNEILSFNVTPAPPAPPTSSISSTCLGKNSNNQWQITISYNNNNANPGARQFILQIGNSTNDASILNSTFVPANPNGSQSYTTANLFNENQTYYVKYAYATCTNCSTFSSFSVPYTMSCSPQPTATPTPTPTVTPTPTPIPTVTPTPTPTPKISACNESCGGSGYTCASELDCVNVTGALGGESCRNPSCPTEPSCVCPQ